MAFLASEALDKFFAFPFILSFNDFYLFVTVPPRELAKGELGSSAVSLSPMILSYIQMPSCVLTLKPDLERPHILGGWPPARGCCVCIPVAISMTCLPQS